MTDLDQTGPSPAEAGGRDAQASVSLPGLSLDQRLRDRGLLYDLASEVVASERRFECRRLLGMGSGGVVYSVHDHSLDRDVAVKLQAASASSASRGPIDAFVSEARIASSLEHPNILPIYDVEITDEGVVFFVMKQVEGISLGTAVEGSTWDQRSAKIATCNEIVTIFVNVLQAVAYAHSRKILHQDVKPDNIMLGTYGEVLLVDWGAARKGESVKEEIYGTPLYMSPEQARRDYADRRSDVYCVAASMFHALTLRLPTWADDPEEFWRKKRAGLIDPLTERERSWMPRPLIAIVLRALESSPGERYASAAEMLVDLQNYQAGLAISAYREPWLARVAQWHRRTWKITWSIAAAAASVIVLVAVLYGERLKETASWGRPVYRDDFTDSTRWENGWTTTAGSYVVRDGMLETTAPNESITYYSRHLSGPMAIEYDGRLLPGSMPCDLSIVFTPDSPFAQATGGGKPSRLYQLKVGAYDNTMVGIYGPEKLLDSNPFQVKPDRPYRIRGEIDGDSIRILVDGVLLCEHHESVPFTGGWIGLYGYYPGKAFDDLRIYTKGIPEKVSALAIGDHDFFERRYDEAASDYQHVASVHAGRAIGNEAAYKYGLALRMAGKDTLAYAWWDSMSDAHWLGVVACHRLEDRLSVGDYPAVAAGIAELFPHSALRRRLYDLWNEAAERSAKDQDPGMAHAGRTGLIAVRDRLFPHERATATAAARLLQRLGMNKELLEQYPEQVVICSETLRMLGRQDEILARYADRPFLAATALIDQGRFAEALAMPSAPRWAVEGAHDMDGSDPGPTPEQLDVIVGDARADRSDRVRASCLLGRYDEALALLASTPPSPLNDEREDVSRFEVLALAGRFNQVHAASGPGGSEAAHAFVELVSGDERAGLAILEQIAPRPTAYNEFTHWFGDGLARPLALSLRGDRSVFGNALDELMQDRWHFQQRPWHCASFIAGRIDEQQFLSQPYRTGADILLLVVKGMRAEWAGDQAAALASYQAFRDLPPVRKGIFGRPFVYAQSSQTLRHHERDPALETFVAWRIRQLAAVPPAEAPIR